MAADYEVVLNRMEYDRLVVAEAQMRMLKTAIMNDASLNYNKDGLTFDIESRQTLFTFKSLFESEYDIRVRELQEHERLEEKYELVD